MKKWMVSSLFLNKENCDSKLYISKCKELTAKNNIFLVVFIIIISLFLINSVYAQIIINEVELNPAGTDTGNEWIELYSDSLINLDGWKLINHDNKVKNLSSEFTGYLVINLDEQWLDNENESISLYNGNNLVSMTPVLKDIYNDNRTWNSCNGKWLFLSSSLNHANNCNADSNPNTNNQTNSNNTGNTNPPTSSQLFLGIDWDDSDIINGEDFKIKIQVFNLDNKDYDIKATIYDDTKIISQTYNQDSKWISSGDYYIGFIAGAGNQSKDIKMRIKESYIDFEGEARINIRIREKGTSVYKKEIEEDIDILKAKISSSSSQSQANQNSAEPANNEEVSITGSNIQDSEVIYLSKSAKKLGTEDIKTSKNIIYQSKNELIKTYSIYFFAFLLIVLCVLLIFKRI